jgi:protein TonB
MATPDCISGQRASARRLLIALIASVLFHFLIVSGWRGSGGSRIEGQMPALQARLEVPDIAVADSPADPQSTPIPSSASAALQTGRAGRPVTVESGHPRVMSRETIATADGSEARFYLARELDRYPVPLVPIRPVRHGDRLAGSVRVWVSIDHIGRVVDVAVADPESAGLYEMSVRDLVLAARFDPARKDGRPVKSRLLLMLEIGA